MADGPEASRDPANTLCKALGPGRRAAKRRYPNGRMANATTWLISKLRMLPLARPTWRNDAGEAWQTFLLLGRQSPNLRHGRNLRQRAPPPPRKSIREVV